MKKKVFLSIGAIFLVGAYVFFSDVVREREKNVALKCSNQLTILYIALATYHEIYGTLPPASVADENGRPMHSWRVLLLPMLDEMDLYRQYRFDEPWNGPNNSKLHDKIPQAFKCPSDEFGNHLTNYVAVVGKNTAWPGTTGSRLRDMKDGASSTILLVEMKNSGINWMEPRDLKFDTMSFKINDPSGQAISSNHHGDILLLLPSEKHNINRRPKILMVDGLVESIPTDISEDTLKALITIKGGEDLTEWWEKRTFERNHLKVGTK